MDALILDRVRVLLAIVSAAEGGPALVQPEVPG
jgi:hypothetical protein